jgi:hypothetical protein
MKQAFDVRFEFLRLPLTGSREGFRDWRIEAMCVLDGNAPLHSQHIERFGDPCIVHASFKLDDEGEYAKAKAELSEFGFPFCAEYSNSYGRFSYWNAGRYYLKPRVNLRDPREVRT